MSTLYTKKFINHNSTYYHIFTLEWKVALEFASIFFVFCTIFWFSFQVSQTLNTFQICFRRPNMVLLIRDQENQLGGSQGCQEPAWRPPNIIHFFRRPSLLGTPQETKKTCLEALKVARNHQFDGLVLFVLEGTV